MIDSHTHILPEMSQALHRKERLFKILFNDSQPTSSLSDLIASMKINKIKKSVVLGYGWTDFETLRISNTYNLSASNDYKENIIPFCSANPKFGKRNLEELERSIKSGAKGIGEIHPDIQDLDLADKNLWSDMMTLARENGMPLLMHSSEPVGHLYPGKGNTTPKKLYDFIQLFPENTIILAHWGGGLLFYELMKEVKQISKNVFYDTAATSFLYGSRIFLVAKHLVGSEKIIFGSDYPLLNPQRILKEMEILSKEEMENISYRNIKSILSI
mgnify:FL=1